MRIATVPYVRHGEIKSIHHDAVCRVHEGIDSLRVLERECFTTGNRQAAKRPWCGTCHRELLDSIRPPIEFAHTDLRPARVRPRLLERLFHSVTRQEAEPFYHLLERQPAGESEANAEMLANPGGEPAKVVRQLFRHYPNVSDR